MADLKLKDFVEDSEIQKLIELDNTIGKVRETYKNAAIELAKGLKINVDGIADLEKLGNIYKTQVKVAGSASNELTEALRKQSEITQAVSKRIEEKLNVEKLSSAELKKLTKANQDNAAFFARSLIRSSSLCIFFISQLQAIFYRYPHSEKKRSIQGRRYIILKYSLAVSPMPKICSPYFFSIELPSVNPFVENRSPESILSAVMLS